MKTSILILIIFFFGFFDANSQISQNKLPYGIKNNLSDISFILMPEVNVERLQAEDLVNDKLKGIPWRFGKNIPVSISPDNSGNWINLPSGDKLWQLGIVSEGAYSINLSFDKYKLPPGAELFIYNTDYSDVLGAFTSYNNQEDKYFAATLARGDSIIVEYYEPRLSEFKGKLNISKVTHAYRDPYQFVRGFGHSGNCNLNVSCPEADDWQDQVNASVMLLTGGNAFCSGVLINNTKEDFKPYILSANHCYRNPSTVVVWFNWQSENCENPDSPPSYNSMSGAVSKARNTGTDFWLMKLNQNIPHNYNPYFAGWNRTLEESLDETITAVHHPRGDIKKFSYSENGLYAAGYLNDAGIGDSHWYITWSGGTTTEPGSSGSAIFDSGGRILGQLHGGYAACGNNSPDWYGRFGKSWEGGGTVNSMLRPWLDPGHINVYTLRGISYFTEEVDPPRNFKATALGHSDIMLTWNVNAKENNIIIAVNEENSFGSPYGPYSLGEKIDGGGKIIYIGNDEVFFHENLKPDTKYFYKAWSFDIDLSYSSYTDAESRTFCSAISEFPFTENFYSEKINSCWQQEIINGKSLWVLNEGNLSGVPESSYKGYANLVFNPFADEQKTKLIIPHISAQKYDYIKISFFYTNNTDEFQDTLNVYYRTDDLSEWIKIRSYYNNIDEWTQAEIKIPETFKNGQIALEAISAGGNGICVDNIVINGFYNNTFTSPKNLSVVKTGSHTVELAWEAPEVNENTGDLLSYNVYRSGLDKPFPVYYNSFIDTGVPVGNYEYYVTAIYENPPYESEPSNTVCAEIIPDKPFEVVISIEGQGNVMPAEGSYLYNSGASLSIMSLADENWHFSHIHNGEDTISVSPVQKILITDDIAFTVVFNKNKYSLNLYSVPENIGLQTGEGIYYHGESVFVKTENCKDHNFLFWHDGDQVVSTRKSFEYEVLDNTDLFAFYFIDYYNIELITIPENSGIVKGGGSKALGSTASVEAINRDNWKFLHWKSGNEIISAENIYSFIVEGDKTLKAVFKNSETLANSAEDSQAVTVFPNPAHEYLYLNFLNILGNVTLEIYNMNGNNVYTNTFIVNERMGNVKQISTNHFSAGLYLIKITTKTQTFSKKVIVQ